MYYYLLYGSKHLNRAEQIWNLWIWLDLSDQIWRSDHAKSVDTVRYCHTVLLYIRCPCGVREASVRPHGQLNRPDGCPCGLRTDAGRTIIWCPSGVRPASVRRRTDVRPASVRLKTAGRTSVRPPHGHRMYCPCGVRPLLWCVRAAPDGSVRRRTDPDGAGRNVAPPV